MCGVSGGGVGRGGGGVSGGKDSGGDSGRDCDVGGGDCDPQQFSRKRCTCTHTPVPPQKLSSHLE